MACPICGKPTAQPWRPFCSKRCADLDLARWLGEEYRIPAVEEDEPDDEIPASPQRDDADEE
jgi:endogenous inhibitor of DNA gyrase (YacG/DUF329 family)